ncbi:MAG: hypothetical protein ACYC3Q_01165 [Gemmatimonadaceae bacterium]
MFARLLIWRRPELSGVIELRERRERHAQDDHEAQGEAARLAS